MYNTKPVVNYKFCMGNIPSMLRVTKEALPDETFRQLKARADKTDSYNEKKDIIFSYVTPKFD